MPTYLRRYAPLLLKICIVAAVIWGGHRTIEAALSELQQKHRWELSQLHWGWGALAGLFYLISQAPPGWFFHGVLRGLRQDAGLFRAMRAYFIGHLGKYVPGKAMVVVMRAAMVRGPGTKSVMAVVAVFYETFTTLACGATLAAILLLFVARDSTMLVVGAIVTAMAMALPTLPPAFARILKLTRVTRSDPNLAAEPIHLPKSLLLRGWISIAVGWFFAGASLWAVLRAIGVNNLELFPNLPILTATVALAIVAGFVSMLPAGVGPRDLVLLKLLVPLLQPLVNDQANAMAFVAVVVLRIVWLAAEVVCAAVLYPLASQNFEMKNAP